MSHFLPRVCAFMAGLCIASGAALADDEPQGGRPNDADPPAMTLVPSSGLQPIPVISRARVERFEAQVSRTLQLRSVHAPVDSEGGAEAEQTDDAERTVPQRLRHRERTVEADDDAPDAAD